MSILTASLSNTQERIVKAALVKRSRGSLVLNRVMDMSITDLINYKKADEIVLTFDYVDFVTTEAELPPLQDKQSLDLLVKNRLENLIPPGSKYTFVLHNAVLPSDSQTPPPAVPQATKQIPKKLYTVFGVPSKFMAMYGIDEALSGRITLSTLDPFSLVSISALYSPEGLVCHVYADRYKVVISFSIGKDLVYARLTPVPKTLKTNEEFNNFYYETINLTYLYLQQNRQAQVDTLIFSGIISNERSLIDNVEKFSLVKVTVLEPQKFIRNCTPAEFQEYLLPIGCALTTEYSNFAPTEERAARFYKSILSKASAVMTVILIGTATFAYIKYNEYATLERDINRRASQLSSTMSSLDGIIGDLKEIVYIEKYIQALQIRERTPFSLYPDTQTVIATDRYSRIDYVSDPVTYTSVLNLYKEKSFNTYTDSYLYSINYNDYINKLRELGAGTSTSGSVLSINDKRYTVQAHIDKTSQEEGTKK